MDFRRTARFHFARSPFLYLAALDLLRSRNWEKRCYLRLIRRGDTVVEAGANVGDFTLLFSDLVGPLGVVHAFEPVGVNFERLRQCMSRCARYQNYRLCPDALGEYRGEVTVYFPELDPAQASLRVQAEGSWTMSGNHRSQVAFQTRLDEYSANLDRVDFLKCDVEGAELLVLQGARQTLLRWTPKILLELNPDWSRSFGYSPEDTLAFLRSCGYRRFWSIGKAWIPLNPDRPVAGNVLCSP
jgi:FkbM family methyltransferase